MDEIRKDWIEDNGKIGFAPEVFVTRRLDEAFFNVEVRFLHRPPLQNPVFVKLSPGDEVKINGINLVGETLHVAEEPSIFEPASEAYLYEARIEQPKSSKESGLQLTVLRSNRMYVDYRFELPVLGIDTKKLPSTYFLKKGISFSVTWIMPSNMDHAGYTFEIYGPKRSYFANENGFINSRPTPKEELTQFRFVLEDGLLPGSYSALIAREDQIVYTETPIDGHIGNARVSTRMPLSITVE